MKLKQGLSPIFIFLTLVLALITLPTGVSADTYGYITVEDWESYNIGVESGSDSLISWARNGVSGDTFEVSDVWAMYGDKSLYTVTDGTVAEFGKFELIPTYDFINKINFTIRYHGDTATAGRWQYNSLKFYDTGDLKLHLKIGHNGGSSARISAIDYDDTENIICSLAVNVWNEVYVEITYYEGNRMNCSVINPVTGNIYGGAGIFSIPTTENWGTFDTINISCEEHGSGAGGQVLVYYDDIIIDVSGSGEGEGSDSPIDGLTGDEVKFCHQVTRYPKSGVCVDLDAILPPYYEWISPEVIEIYDFEKLTCNITVFDFYVIEGYAVPVTGADWYLSVNGNYVGSYDYIFNVGYGLEVVRWVFDGIVIIDTHPVFEIYYPGGIPALGIATNDQVSSFYDSHSQYHDYVELWGDGQVDGTFLPMNHNFMYCYYYPNNTYSPVVDNPGYTDSIHTKKTDYYKYDSVLICAFTEDITCQNSIHIYHNGDEVFFHNSFPKQFYDYKSPAYAFTPLDIGTYQICLERNNLNKSYANITVTANPTGDNYFIYTVDNPTLNDESYRLYYGYNNTEGNIGIIAWKYNSNPDSAYFVRNVEANTTGSFPYSSEISSDNEYKIYWFLLSDNNRTSSLEYMHIHSIITLSDTWLKVKYNSLLDTAGSDFPQVFSWSHNLIGFDVQLYLSGSSIHVCSNVLQGDYSLIMTESGNYIAELRLITSDGYVVLDSASFRITTDDRDGISSDGGGMGVFSEIDQPLGSIIGMIISVFTLTMPFALAKGLKMHQNIHPVIYALSGSMGIAISVILGLFPKWVPFFLISVGLIIITIVYFTKSKGSES